MDDFSLEFFGNHINKLLENTNIGVRSETINLVKEIYLYKRKDIFKFVKFNKDSIKVIKIHLIYYIKFIQ
jgi:hypothetical protein